MTDQTAAGLAEPSTVAYLVTGLARGEPSICFEDERGDYGDEDHMPIFEALVRKSDYAALLAQLEEQRAVSARMEADARPGNAVLVPADKLRELQDDARRLDHLQAHGATVEILPARLAWKFQVGGFHGAVSYNIRAAIDAAIASQQAGGKA